MSVGTRYTSSDRAQFWVLMGNKRCKVSEICTCGWVYRAKWFKLSKCQSLRLSRNGFNPKKSLNVMKMVGRHGPDCLDRFFITTNFSSSSNPRVGPKRKRSKRALLRRNRNRAERRRRAFRLEKERLICERRLLQASEEARFLPLIKECVRLTNFSRIFSDSPPKVDSFELSYTDLDSLIPRFPREVDFNGKEFSPMHVTLNVKYDSGCWLVSSPGSNFRRTYSALTP
jgi:hypothetical protein